MSGYTTAVVIAGVVISAASASYSAYVANDNAIDASKKADEQAAMEMKNSQDEAAKIREKGQRVQAAQASALAGSGITLDGQGSGQALIDETGKLAEQDALAVITGGAQRAKLLNMDSASYKKQGSSALVSGGMNVGSTLIGGYNQYQKAKQPSTVAQNYELGTTKLTTQKTKYSLLGD
jgi:hypothetical protein